MSLLSQQQNGGGYATIGPDVPLLRPPDSNKVIFPQIENSQVELNYLFHFLVPSG